METADTSPSGLLIFLVMFLFIAGGLGLISLFGWLASRRQQPTERPIIMSHSGSVRSSSEAVRPLGPDADARRTDAPDAGEVAIMEKVKAEQKAAMVALLRVYRQAGKTRDQARAELKLLSISFGNDDWSAAAPPPAAPPAEPPPAITPIAERPTRAAYRETDPALAYKPLNTKEA